MGNGFIKLHRKIIESSVWEKPDILKVWLWCLIKATHTNQEFPFNGKDIKLTKGEFITGREKACKELKISPQTYRTAITYLKSTSRITTKSTNQFTLISILKWNDYQEKSTSKTTNELTNQQPATNQPLTTYKKVKNDKNDIIAGKPAREIEPIINLFKELNPSYAGLYKNKTERGAAERLTKLHSFEGVEKLIKDLIYWRSAPFCPVITKPTELENKLAKFELFLIRQ